jgi:hypothetical protein
MPKPGIQVAWCCAKCHGEFVCVVVLPELIPLPQSLQHQCLGTGKWLARTPSTSATKSATTRT